MNTRPTLEGLMTRAIAGAITSAQEGNLPLFAWTLGLPQAALKDMIEQCFPELGDLEPVSPTQYAMFVEATPHDFHALLDLIGQHRSPDVPASHTDWLARAIPVCPARVIARSTRSGSTGMRTM